MLTVVVYMTLIAIGFYFGKWLGAIGLIAIYFFYFHSRQIIRQQGHNKNDKNSAITPPSITDLAWAYQELNISKHADKNTIIKTRKKLLNNYHPDKLGKISEAEKAIAENKITQINKAYQAIKKAKGF
ncbi:MAG: DnaJ domain-containing protein [Gammaproteobacteria bacterium]|nr:DnaJ domain-containing protein [Gammaproteobacteria bacterium]